MSESPDATPGSRPANLDQGLWRRSAVLYLLSMTAMLAFATFALVLVYHARPHQDNGPIIVTILGFLGTMFPALMALIKAAENSQVMHQIHISINSRMDELLKQVAVSSREQGRLEEQAASAVTVESAKAAAVAATTAAIAPVLAAAVKQELAAPARAQGQDQG